MKIKNQSFLKLLFISFFAVCCIASSFAAEPDSVSYRGKREPKESGNFSVLNIVTSRVDSGTVRFDILFNQAIDPNSAGKAAFYINGTKVSSKGKTEFSKDGKKIRIELAVKDSSFSLELEGISSYNGKELRRTKVKLSDSGELKVSGE